MNEFEEQNIAEAIQGNVVGGQISKHSLFKLGQLIWPFSYKFEDTDDGAVRHLLTRANKGVAERHAYWTLLATELLQPQNQLAYTASSLWCHQGFPQVVISHTGAKAFMINKPPMDVQPPWRAFYIELPRHILYVESDKGDRTTLAGVLVASIFHAPTGKARWAYFTLTESQTTVWKHGATTEHLLDGSFIEQCIGRIILNVCAAMRDKTNVKSPKKKKESGEPRIRTYHIIKTEPTQ